MSDILREAAELYRECMESYEAQSRPVVQMLTDLAALWPPPALIVSAADMEPIVVPTREQT